MYARTTRFARKYLSAAYFGEHSHTINSLDASSCFRFCEAHEQYAITDVFAISSILTSILDATVSWPHQLELHERKINTGIIIFIASFCGLLTLTFAARKVRPPLSLVNVRVEFFR